MRVAVPGSGSSRPRTAPAPARVDRGRGRRRRGPWPRTTGPWTRLPANPACAAPVRTPAMTRDTIDFELRPQMGGHRSRRPMRGIGRCASPRWPRSALRSGRRPPPGVPARPAARRRNDRPGATRRRTRYATAAPCRSRSPDATKAVRTTRCHRYWTTSPAKDHTINDWLAKHPASMHVAPPSLLDQPGGTLVRPAHRPTPAPRRPHQRCRTATRCPRLDQVMERGPKTVALDQNRRRDPRLPR